MADETVVGASFFSYLPRIAGNSKAAANYAIGSTITHSETDKGIFLRDESRRCVAMVTANMSERWLVSVVTGEDEDRYTWRQVIMRTGE